MAEVMALTNSELRAVAQQFLDTLTPLESTYVEGCKQAKLDMLCVVHHDRIQQLIAEAEERKARGE